MNAQLKKIELFPTSFERKRKTKQFEFLESNATKFWHNYVSNLFTYIFKFQFNRKHVYIHIELNIHANSPTPQGPKCTTLGLQLRYRTEPTIQTGGNFSKNPNITQKRYKVADLRLVHPHHASSGPSSWRAISIDQGYLLASTMVHGVPRTLRVAKIASALRGKGAISIETTPFRGLPLSWRREIGGPLMAFAVRKKSMENCVYLNA